MIQVGNPQGGDPSTVNMVIASGATDTFLVAAGIVGDGTLTVAGSILANANGTSLISTSAIVDKGTIAANLGTLQIAGTLTPSSTGSLTIGNGATLEFLGTANIGVATGVDFISTGNLRIDDLKGFGATIGNFVNTDTIQFNNLNTSSLSVTYGSSQSQLVVSDGNVQIALNFSTTQTLSALSIGTGANGLATLTHH